MAGTARTREMLWMILDSAAAVALFALSARGAAARPPNFGLPDWVSVGAAAAVAAPVAVRRLWPDAAFTVVLATYSLEASAGVSNNPAVAVALCLYSAAVSRPPRQSAPPAALAIALSAAAELAGILASKQPVAWQVRLDIEAATVTVLAAAWAVGAGRGAQLRYQARTAQQATRRAVADERLRIARELHDVITHSMSLITVKASVANYLIESRPEEVRATLTLIETTGREALTEMRRMLGVLRADSDEPAPGDPGDERAPAPGLAELAALAEHAAEAGVHVDLDVPADHDLPEGIALAAYRIVQEALTNVAKHAAPTRCRVRVCRTGRNVLINVTDDGPGRGPRPPAEGGHGIIGMRERAALFGGELEAGPRPHGGFRVAARLPCAASDSAPSASATPQSWPAGGTPGD
jgi:signal transduction histidine kinase